MILFTFVSLIGCVDEYPMTTHQAGGWWNIEVPSNVNTLCLEGNDRLVLVGVSFQCPGCRATSGYAPANTRPVPSLSTQAGTPWAPQFIGEPTRDHYQYRDIQVTSWIAPVEGVWNTLIPTDGGALNNFRYPTPHIGWYLEPNPLWMHWKTGNGTFISDYFDSVGRTLYGDSVSYSWGSASMQRGSYRLEGGAWHERWVLLCRNGGVTAEEILPYLNMHDNAPNPALTPQITLERHPITAGCTRVVYSCHEQLVPVNSRIN